MIIPNAVNVVKLTLAHYFSVSEGQTLLGRITLMGSSLRWQAALFSDLFDMLHVPNVVNLLIILGKRHIHSCAVNCKPLLFKSYLAYVDDMRKIEAHADAGDEERTTAYRNNWELLLRAD